AGRDKHEFHNYEPLGKHGFTRPDAVTDEVREVTVQELDENAPLYAADGLAEETTDGYRIDARDVVDDGYDADVVKVLGDGQVRHELAVVADAFTANAVEKIESAGGDAALSDRAETAEDAETESDTEAEDEE
ncbi:MAG: uL15m family ribosomal protein, partial [Haloplanus sp.]